MVFLIIPYAADISDMKGIAELLWLRVDGVKRKQNMSGNAKFTARINFKEGQSLKMIHAKRFLQHRRR